MRKINKKFLKHSNSIDAYFKSGTKSRRVSCEKRTKSKLKRQHSSNNHYVLKSHFYSMPFLATLPLYLASYIHRSTKFFSTKFENIHRVIRLSSSVSLCLSPTLAITAVSILTRNKEQRLNFC